MEGLVHSSVCFLTLLLWKSKAGEVIREVHDEPCPARPRASSRLASVQLDREQNKGQRKRNDETFLTVQIDGQKNNTIDKDRKKRSTEKHNLLFTSISVRWMLLEMSSFLFCSESKTTEYFVFAYLNMDSLVFWDYVSSVSVCKGKCYNYFCSYLWFALTTIWTCNKSAHNSSHPCCNKLMHLLM